LWDHPFENGLKLIPSPFTPRHLKGIDEGVFHDGVDFAVPVGTPINAAENGVGM